MKYDVLRRCDHVISGGALVTVVQHLFVFPLPCPSQTLVTSVPYSHAMLRFIEDQEYLVLVFLCVGYLI